MSEPAAVTSDADLIENYRVAKSIEKAAITDRKAAQDALAARIGVDVEGGTTKAEVAGIACSTRQSITRSVNGDGAEALRAKLPSALFDRLIRWKPEVDAREFNYLKNNEPETYRIVAEYITVKPGSVSVEIKE